MNRLNLDETWTLCLKMWRWIAKQKKAGSQKSVGTLKREWLENHGYKDEEVMVNCFFCEYTSRKDGAIDCNKCPAAKIDSDFHCTDSGYFWKREPLAFLAKLVGLNKIRLKRAVAKSKEGRKKLDPKKRK